MEYIVTAREMRECDMAAIKDCGIPAMVLMERAALSILSEMEDWLYPSSRIAIFAGCGNNGGDGLALARLLSEKGIQADIFLTGNTEKMSRECESQLSILKQLGIAVNSKSAESEYDMVVDCLFGTGLTREITGIYEEAVRKINHYGEKGSRVIAADIPSGVCADSGKILGCAVKADLTVALQYGKAGHYLYPGKTMCGHTVVHNIGIPESFHNIGREPSFFSYRAEDINDVLPKREPSGNKGTFGKVLLIAGSKDMAGAALLCGKTILRSGAGMLKIITAAENRDLILRELPEAMIYAYEGGPEKEKVKQSIAWSDVIVAGCGISTDENAELLMEMVLEQGEKRAVIDADGLNLIAREASLQEKLYRYQKGRVILTPHPGEFVRLAGISMSAYKEDPAFYIRKLAEQYGCVIAGKDAVTLVASPDERAVYLNRTGNDGMATAGSGDVLAGVTGALSASLESFQAACAGVYLHGIAGDLAAEKQGKRGMLASDISAELKELLKEKAAEKEKGI